jgi:hypothetical protein
MTSLSIPTYRRPASAAIDRDIDHELSLIRALETAMARMSAGRRLDQAEAQWNRRLDRLAALEQERDRLDG